MAGFGAHLELHFISALWIGQINAAVLFLMRIDSDCIRLTIRTVGHLLMRHADQPVTRDMSKVWIVSFLT